MQRCFFSNKNDVQNTMQIISLIFFFRIGDINFLFIFIFFSMADSTMIFSSHWLQFYLSVYETEGCNGKL